MLTVGLTGGIGAGKSTVAGRLAALGAVVVDADAIAREVVLPGTPGLAAVAEAFGPQVLTADGALDRAALGAIVFADPAARTRLESLLHPRIATLTAERVAAAPAQAVVVHDVPLLVEKAMGAAYHLVLVVDVPAAVRVARLVRDRGMAEQQAWERIAAQADDDARRSAADVLLDNSGAAREVQEAVDALWHGRLLPFEENVRRRRPAHRDVLAVVPADPTWPAQGARVVARIRHALGAAATAVVQVGPTAAGLAAPDVLEVEVTAVPEESAAVADRLASIGFVRGDAGPAHRSADPGRAVDVRVREVGGTGSAPGASGPA